MDKSVVPDRYLEPDEPIRPELRQAYESRLGVPMSDEEIRMAHDMGW